MSAVATGRAASAGSTGGAARDGEALSWPQEASHEPSMKIGEVVELLQATFPALSISKVRYLESEDLIHPHRVGNGYRRYSEADVERLRYTLAAQRDEYLPLSVIRERLAELDRRGGVLRPQLVAVEGHTVSGPVDLDGLCVRTGATREQVDELVRLGLLVPDARGLYGAGAQRVVELALTAHRAGLPLRNLRPVRSAAERVADTLEVALAPQARQGQDQATASGAELARTLGELYTLLLARAVESWD